VSELYQQLSGHNLFTSEKIGEEMLLYHRSHWRGMMRSFTVVAIGAIP
jgi:hypothetical protein